MKILFVCSANKQRSKTAEDYFASKYNSHEFLSAGTNLKICRKEGTTALTEDLLQWADKVYVMEQRHLGQIQKYTGSRYYSKVTVLNIPDIYKYYSQELLKILKEKITI
ncbi:phosphotyrosine protein phosphatase [Winogradskyella undariae]|uniref:phosphotyrosine protein phosphatase n=1 Tax=Winogradskyella undariae TaxID=1285465 RepID=UPI00156A94E5|nr:phosphotyrosine protein phosphatase [Winogradskyella undariae]NRR90919.1 phosphotyrosine protein phosphatase [Winogradskyella undariae]